MAQRIQTDGLTLADRTAYNAAVMRVGAVNYLNSKPLVCGLEQHAPDLRLSFDLPSRLADSLAAGRLDVALIPTVEFFRAPGYSIVSDACVACRGPVLSVKLHFRVPPPQVRRVALDEGSRTSAALTKILLAQLAGVRPTWETLPIGCGLETTDADAVLLIGDRAITCEERGASGEERGARSGVQGAECFDHELECCDVWDLGEVWCRWTGLPFVFAMWIARPEVDAAAVAGTLAAARDEGLQQLAQIAAREAAIMQIPEPLALDYLRDNLHFVLGPRERQGLRRFHQLCVAHEIIPNGSKLVLKNNTVHDCPS